MQKTSVLRTRFLAPNYAFNVILTPENEETSVLRTIKGRMSWSFTWRFHCTCILVIRVYTLIAAVGTCECACRHRYFCVHTGKHSLIREWHLAVIVDSKSITSTVLLYVYKWFPLDTSYHNTHSIIGSSCICVCVYWPANIHRLRNGI